MFSQQQVVVAVYSNSFVSQDTWYASPSPRLLADICKLNIYETARYIATIKGSSGETKIALGDPVIMAANTRTKDLYVPHWLLSSIGVEGIGEELSVSFSRCEDYERATKLSFQYLAEFPEGFDMKELLETPLSQLGILQKGQILPAPVLEGSLVVKHVEPETDGSSYVFLDGLEVEFEFESDVLPVPTPEPEPAPIPAPVPESPFLSGMLPPNFTTEPIQSSGQRQLVKKVFPNKSSFIPFSGQGRTLGN